MLHGREGSTPTNLRITAVLSGSLVAIENMLTQSVRGLHASPQVRPLRSCPRLTVAVQFKAFLKHTNSLREQATRAVLQTISNSMAITDGNDKKIGMGVYLFGSLFNHSCQPNCVVSFAGVLLGSELALHVDALACETYPIQVSHLLLEYFLNPL